MARTVLTVAAVVGAVVAVAGVAAVAGPERVAQRPAAPRAAAPVPAGERVAADGTVLARPGQPVLFCPPRVVMWRGEFGDGPRPPDCGGGIPTEGVDLGALARREERDGVVWGGAWLTGVFAGGTLTVTGQEAPRPGYGERTDLYTSPCPEPAGGWPGDKPIPGDYGTSDGERLYEQPGLGAVERYERENPGEVVHHRYALPEKNASVVVVVVFDVARAEAALRPAYGDRLCVLESRYTVAQVKAAKKAAGDFVGHPLVTSGGGFTASRDGQPLVTIDADYATPEIEAFVASQPAGLVRADYWLAPVDEG
jgi:hypothetical protein